MPETVVYRGSGHHGIAMAPRTEGWMSFTRDAELHGDEGADLPHRATAIPMTRFGREALTL